MVTGSKQRLVYAGEAILIAAGFLPLFMLLYPLALLTAPAAVLAGYAVIRPAWMLEGRQERRQYVHLAAGLAAVGILLFVLSLAHVV